VERETVRQGLAELAAEELIEKRKERGSVVSAAEKRLALLSFRGFSEVVGATQHRANTAVLQTPVPEPWPDPFFYSLSDVEHAAGTIYLKRLRSVEDDVSVSRGAARRARPIQPDTQLQAGRTRTRWWR
jgi:DNA-binding GntR family transcriptional regulator